MDVVKIISGITIVHVHVHVHVHVVLIGTCNYYSLYAKLQEMNIYSYYL